MKRWNSEAIELLKKQSEQSRNRELVSDGNGLVCGFNVASLPVTLKRVPADAKVPPGTRAVMLAGGEEKIIVRKKRKRRSS